MRQNTETQALLSEAAALGLNVTEAWKHLQSATRCDDPRSKLALAHLKTLCAQTRETDDVIRWLETEKLKPPGELSSLAIDIALREFDAIIGKPVRHRLELAKELCKLKERIEVLLEQRRRLVDRVDGLRRQLELLIAHGVKLDHLEFSLARVEGQTLFGHEPDEEKLSSVEQELAKAQQDWESREGQLQEIRALAEGFVERRKDQLTIAQHEKLQNLLEQAENPAHRRELWNLLRDLDTRLQKKVKFKKPKALTGRSPVDVKVLGSAWESLSAISTHAPNSHERARALDDLIGAMTKKGRSAEKSLTAIHRSLEADDEEEDE